MNNQLSTQEVGKTSATDREANTSEKFTFWLAPKVIVNPFDIVEVEQVSHQGQSNTFGLVTILEHKTDSPNHLANFISSNFGELTEEPNTPRQGTTVAHVNVLSNDKNIYMPVSSDKIVKFADEKGIQIALGIDAMEPKNRIPAGLIKMSNGTTSVAYIDRRYVLGPESAHVNISGISGLATKTSYAMFLIQSILQTISEEEKKKLAVIILNVKHGDLLQIHQRREKYLTKEEYEMWEALGLNPEPFIPERIHYYLPRGKDGYANSFLVPNIYKIYTYDLEGTIDKLEFLFTEVSDTSGALEALIGDIIHGITAREGQFKDIHSWENLLNSPPLFKEGRTQKFGDHYTATVGKFRRLLRRMVKTMHSGIFVDNRSTSEKLLSEEIINNINGGHIYVIDIAQLKEYEQQLVFGDLLKTIYSLKTEPPEGRDANIPEKIIFFVDELNKYAPAGARVSALTEQVLEIAERGRSLGVILISAQQFMSAVHQRVTGNCATKIIGRSGSAEILQPDYRFLDNEIKNNVTRLSKGELLLSHAIYRQPVKVIFPKPVFKQQEF